MNVKAIDFHSQWVSQSSYPVLRPGAVTELTIRYRNTGTAAWIRGVAGQQANLGLVGDGGFLAEGWPSSDRLAAQQEDVVVPGATGTFVFKVRAPMKAGDYRLAVRPVIDGTTWMEDNGAFFALKTEPLGAMAFTDLIGQALAVIRVIALPMLAMLLSIFVLIVLWRTLRRMRLGSSGLSSSPPR